jgi:hypothetical protein
MRKNGWTISSLYRRKNGFLEIQEGILDLMTDVRLRGRSAILTQVYASLLRIEVTV